MIAAQQGRREECERKMEMGAGQHFTGPLSPAYWKGSSPNTSPALFL